MTSQMPPPPPATTEAEVRMQRRRNRKATNERRIALLSNHVPDRFEIVRVLGVGAYGVVYDVREKTSQRRYAIKMQYNKSEWAYFVREVSAMVALRRHACVVQLAEAGISAVDPCIRWLVMERCSMHAAQYYKRPLRDRVLAATAVARDVASALAYMNAVGLAHRDVKPNNILLVHTPDPDNAGHNQLHAKLCDFGMAKDMRTDGHQSGTAHHTGTIGSLAYRAPELLEQPSEHEPGAPPGKAYGKRVDVWSYGMTLLDILAGRCVVRGDDVAQVLRNVHSLVGASHGNHPAQSDTESPSVALGRFSGSHLLSRLINVNVNGAERSNEVAAVTAVRPLGEMLADICAETAKQQGDARVQHVASLVRESLVLDPHDRPSMSMLYNSSVLFDTVLCPEMPSPPPAFEAPRLVDRTALHSAKAALRTMINVLGARYHVDRRVASVAWRMALDYTARIDHPAPSLDTLETALFVASALLDIVPLGGSAIRQSNRSIRMRSSPPLNHKDVADFVQTLEFDLLSYVDAAVPAGSTYHDGQ
jgi:serine/threonine protein kinase